MPDLPCVVFAFNRPKKLQRVLSALRYQSVERLIVFVDGPRSESDVECVEQCRALAKAVDWTEIELHFWEQNHGLRRLVENVSLVFKKFPQAVFVEDDCLPMSDYYAFMRMALDRYENEEMVFSICGYQPINPDKFVEYPYDLVSSARFTCWGWATWSDRWESIEPYLLDEERFSECIRRVSGFTGVDLQILARKLSLGEEVRSWAARVALICLYLKKVHLLPTRGLIKNIGNDMTGTHGSMMGVIRDKIFHNRNVVESLGSEIRWLDNFDINCDYASLYREFVYRTRSFSIRRWLSRFKVLIRRYLWPGPERLFNQVIDENLAIEPTKKALLSYIVHPFYIPEDDPRFLRHINIWHAKEIVRSLNSLGYTVDVVDYRDTQFKPNTSYDLFIGHGGTNFVRIVKMLPNDVQKVYFTTGSYWKYHNQQEVARFEALESRRGVKLKFDRYIHDSEEKALRVADGIIGIGNEATRKTYSDFDRVWMINGTSLYDDTFDWCRKDYDAGSDHFLFFASTGSVHKGLDLLVEAFIQLEQHLWICCRLDQDFKRVYEKELTQAANIHLVGWVQPRGERFYQMMRRCNFCMLPSCSEGQSQSVVEAMNQGLIPVVSRASGVDVSDFGFFIDPPEIGTIKKLAFELSSYPQEHCREMSKMARVAAINYYSEEDFSLNFNKSLSAILKSSSKSLQ